MARKEHEFHGETRKDGFRSSEYIIWTGMIQRCTNPSAGHYKNYGGRGIKVCDKWRWLFASFLQDMGRRPSPLHSIDRWPDNDGNYEPGNTRWALRPAQDRNRGNNNNVIAFGVDQCLTDWATALGCSPSTISRRIERGWMPEDAVSIPSVAYDAHKITINDETLSLSGWSKKSGISVSTLAHRLDTGWLPLEHDGE